MNNNIPVNDQEKPFVEEHDRHVDKQGDGTQQPEPVARQAEQGARTYTPSPEQPPVWIGYVPGAPPPWAWQAGAYTPYPPRRPSRWPWIVLTLFLLFLLISGGVVVLFESVSYHASRRWAVSRG